MRIRGASRKAIDADFRGERRLRVRERKILPGTGRRRLVGVALLLGPPSPPDFAVRAQVFCGGGRQNLNDADIELIHLANVSLCALDSVSIPPADSLKI